MDDILPFDQRKYYFGKTFFGQVDEDGSAWSAFLEKAYAKVHGTYERISGGFGTEVFQYYLGIPTEKIIRGDLGWKTK